MTGIDILKTLYPWPVDKPDLPFDNRGWFSECNKECLARLVSSRTQIVVELGSWLGLSTRWLLDNAPNAIVIAIDHWRGSPENANDPVIPVLYKTFISNCWGHKDRLIPLRNNTLDGLAQLKILEIHPDVIYLDAGHDYKSASDDIEACMPFECPIIGDDFNPVSWPGVTQAVWEAAVRYNIEITVWKSAWMFNRKRA